eukprot:6475039-Amphidinium_carterae.1
MQHVAELKGELRISRAATNECRERMELLENLIMTVLAVNKDDPFGNNVVRILEKQQQEASGYLEVAMWTAKSRSRMRWQLFAPPARYASRPGTLFEAHSIGTPEGRDQHVYAVSHHTPMGADGQLTTHLDGLRGQIANHFRHSNQAASVSPHVKDIAQGQRGSSSSSQVKTSQGGNADAFLNAIKGRPPTTITI